MRRTSRLAVVAVTTIAAMGVLSACNGSDDAGAGSTSTPPSSLTTGVPPPPASTAATSSPPVTETQTETPTIPKCTTPDLTGSLVPGSPGAGQMYAQLILTNGSTQTCTIYGYGGAELQGPDGAKIPTDLVRDETTPPTTVTLAPGASASSQLHWSDVTGTGDSTGAHCQPVAARLAVIPPDETTALDVAWTFGSVCEQGHIDQKPYVASK